MVDEKETSEPNVLRPTTLSYARRIAEHAGMQWLPLSASAGVIGLGVFLWVVEHDRELGAMIALFGLMMVGICWIAAAERPPVSFLEDDEPESDHIEPIDQEGKH